MADAKRDNNQITTLLAVSNADGVTPVVLWADPTTHRLLVDLPAGSGTVTTVSVVTANGFAGTVATATTTPAITLTTSVTGVLKGNGTAISAASDGTDYLSSSTGVLLSNVTTAATASKVVQRDANANVLANNVVLGYATTATAAGTTTLTVSSAREQFFTGTTTQTVVLPDATTLALGFQFRVHNNSTGLVTVQTNGGATLWTIGASSDVLLTCTSIGTAAGTWDVHYTATGIATGKKLAFSNSLSFAGTDGTVMTFPTTSATIARTDAGNTFTGHQTIEGVTSTGATGTGKFVFDTSPTLVTPTLGVASATSINKVAITAPATSATITVADGKTLTASNSITLAGTDATTMTFPTTSATIARTDAGQTFTGVQVMTSPKIITQISDTNGNAIVAITATASAVNYVKLTNAATGTAGPQIAAEGETNTDLKISAKGTGKINHQSGMYQTLQSDTDGATVTFDMSVSNLHTVTLGGNRTLALSNVAAGQSFVLRLAQDATGSRTVTWFTTIKWAGGSAPTLTTTASKTDVFGFICTSAGNYDGFVIGQNL